MAALWWHSQVRHVSEALSGIGELKFVIENSLKQDGFNNVTLNSLEVAGGKNDSWLSIGHFLINGRQYWEVIMCSSNNADVAKSLVTEVTNTINGLRFL